jgi:hypothetical protein
MLDEVPPNMAVTVDFDKAGFLPAIRAIETRTSDILLPDGENRLLPRNDWTAAGFDGRSGLILFLLASDARNPVRGTATVTNVQDPRQPVLYFDAGSDPTSVGLLGGIANVTPGVYRVTFNAPPRCTARAGLYGYPVGSSDAYPHSVSVPVVEGRVTMAVGLDCRSANVGR